MPTTKVISFYGDCPAGTNITLVSERISNPFILDSISAHFPLNLAWTMHLKFFISPDPSAPTTEEPTGFNILAEYGQVDYLTGDDDSKFILTNAISPTSPTWLKIYAINSDAFDHTIDAQMKITIE
jgi:hypothetical protein